MMKAAQIALGEIKVMRRQKRPNPEEGQPPIEVEVAETVLNLGAAARTLELLAAEVTRQEGDLALVANAPASPNDGLDANKMIEAFMMPPGKDEVN